MRRPRSSRPSPATASVSPDSAVSDSRGPTRVRCRSRTPSASTSSPTRRRSSSRMRGWTRYWARISRSSTSMSSPMPAFRSSGRRATRSAACACSTRPRACGRAGSSSRSPTSPCSSATSSSAATSCAVSRSNRAAMRSRAWPTYAPGRRSCRARCVAPSAWATHCRSC